MTRDKRYPAFLVVAASFLLALAVIASKAYLYDREDHPRPITPVTAQPVSQAHSDTAQTQKTAANMPIRAASAPESKKNVKDRIRFPGFPIDVNTATKDDLMLISGIGEKTAERILEKRAELGSFGSIEDLLEVKYIGRSKLEKIRPFVTVKAVPGGSAR